MPNPFNQKSKSFTFSWVGIKASSALLLFIITSWIFHKVDNFWISSILKIIIFIYIFFPLLQFFTPSIELYQDSIYFISNFFYSIIGTDNYKSLITLYLLAPLITLYFKEHGLILSEFISTYDKTKKTSETSSHLDIDKDKYDLDGVSVHMGMVYSNERSLNDYKLVGSYIKWSKIIGNKRRNFVKNIRTKILMIISMLIIGMPLSLSNEESVYYFLSMSIFIFMMLIILVQILNSIRSIVKLKMLDLATNAAYYYYEIDKDTSEPFI